MVLLFNEMISECGTRHLPIHQLIIKTDLFHDALEWLAAMGSHVPNKGEQMVRYYGYYSTMARGTRKKSDQDELISSILEPNGTSKEYRKNWARLIHKIYEVDPLTCPKCKGRMRVLAFIEYQEVIKKILKHLGMWAIKVRPPPKRANGPPLNIHIDSSNFQVPPCDDYL